MKRKILTTIAFVGTFIIGVSIGTSGDDGAPSTAAPTVTETATGTATETVTVAPEPKPEPTEQAAPEPAPAPEPEPAADVEFDDITAIAMDAVWDSTPASEQDEICLGWLIDDSRMLDAFMEGAGEDFNRAQVRDFFDGECL